MGKLLLSLMASSSCAMIALAPLPALAAKKRQRGRAKLLHRNGGSRIWQSR